MKTFEPIALAPGDCAKFSRACYGLPSAASPEAFNPQRFAFPDSTKIEVMLPYEVHLRLQKASDDQLSLLWNAEFTFFTTRKTQTILISFEPKNNDTIPVLRRAIQCGKKFIYQNCKEKQDG